MPQCRSAALACAAFWLAAPLTAGAGPFPAGNLLTNGSFASPVSTSTWAAAPRGTDNYANPTPWQVTARAGPSKPTTIAFPLLAPHGLQIGFPGDDVSAGTLVQ